MLFGFGIANGPLPPIPPPLLGFGADKTAGATTAAAAAADDDDEEEDDDAGLLLALGLDL